VYKSAKFTVNEHFQLCQKAKQQRQQHKNFPQHLEPKTTMQDRPTERERENKSERGEVKRRD